MKMKSALLGAAAAVAFAPVMAQAAGHEGPRGRDGNVSIIYYYACVLLGAYFLLNLFVAVLKEKFAIATSVMKMSKTVRT